MKSKIVVFVVGCLFFSREMVAQMNASIPPLTKIEGVSNDSLYSLIEKEPAFGLYRDNYFITGADPRYKWSEYTCDLRFQLSMRVRLTHCTLPHKSYLFLSFSQNTTWDIYQVSAPFRNSEYNPGLHWARPIIADSMLKGLCMLSIEHRSNGAGDEPDDRDCNWVTLYGKYYFSPKFSIEGKAYIPFYLYYRNKDVHKYRGFLNVALNYCSSTRKFLASLQFDKTTKSLVSGNFTAEAAYALYLPFNIYAFAQYYNGYAENITQYKTYFHEIRIGLCFKSAFFSVH